MAKIKSYSDLQQSKKLAEILPLESADMIWILANPDLPMIKAIAYEDSEKSKFYETLPAWSLGALLNTLPDIKIRGSKKIGYIISYNKNIATKRHFDIVDACYEMIEHLHELKML